MYGSKRSLQHVVHLIIIFFAENCHHQTEQNCARNQDTFRPNYVTPKIQHPAGEINIHSELMMI